MIQQKKSLVIMAAGIGSRFKGGVKQLKNVGPCGETIMEYSVYDAIEAGFNRVVFIIRKDIEELFNEMAGDRIRKMCEKHGVEMACAYQEKENLPGGFVCPEDRTKPWGTGHALLSCKGLLPGGFAVINADDYYGKDAYKIMADFLDEDHDEDTVYGLAGFRLGNTISEHGGVTRGLCRVDEQGWLTEIQETKNIRKFPEGAGVEENGAVRSLEMDTPVSMNMWAFSADELDKLEKRFVDFLANGGIDAPSSEFLIPIEVDGMLREGSAKVKVLPTPGQWYGMTFQEDVPVVQGALKNMAEARLYPSPLCGN